MIMRSGLYFAGFSITCSHMTLLQYSCSPSIATRIAWRHRKSGGLLWCFYAGACDIGTVHAANACWIQITVHVCYFNDRCLSVLCLDRESRTQFGGESCLVIQLEPQYKIMQSKKGLSGVSCVSSITRLVYVYVFHFNSCTCNNAF